MHKTLKTIIGWVIYVAILAGLVYGIPKLLVWALGTSYPMASITSGSMWPALKKGDLVFIKGVAGPSEVSVGDIVVYRNPKGFTIHRAIAKRQDTLITKGDANNVSDDPVKYSDIIGKAMTINGKAVKIPLLGNISLLFKKQQ